MRLKRRLYAERHADDRDGESPGRRSYRGNRDGIHHRRLRPQDRLVDWMTFKCTGNSQGTEAMNRTIQDDRNTALSRRARWQYSRWGAGAFSWLKRIGDPTAVHNRRCTATRPAVVFANDYSPKNDISYHAPCKRQRTTAIYREHARPRLESCNLGCTSNVPGPNHTIGQRQVGSGKCSERAH